MNSGLYGDLLNRRTILCHAVTTQIVLHAGRLSKCKLYESD